MLRKIKRSIKQVILRFLGAEKVIRELEEQNRKLEKKLHNHKLKILQHRREIKTHQHQLDRANSCLEFATIDTELIRKSPKFANFHAIISLLTPMDISGGIYRRFGRDHDGGYVMLDDFSSRKIDAAYSFGIMNDVSWDEDIAKLGIPVFMFDHTIDKLPEEHSHFHFFKQGVSGNPNGKDLETLTNLLIRNGHEKSDNLILKMDIEGDEWSVFKETPTEVINQFSQIVIEFHGLDPNKSMSEISEISSILEKINQTHQSVHVHANVSMRMNWLGDLPLPRVLEVTYVRKSDYADRLIKNTRTFPTDIDQSTFKEIPDVYLGRFTCLE